MNDNGAQFTKVQVIISISNLSTLGRFGETNSIPAQIIDSEIFAKENVTYEAKLRRASVGETKENSPMIHKDPPGMLMSKPVNDEIQVPCTSKT